MTFGEAIRTVARKYAEFGGRAGRPELWWWLLFVTLVAAALNLFSVVSIGDTANLGALLSALWGIAILLVFVPLSVRTFRNTASR